MENYAELMFHEAVAELQKADGSYEKYQVGYRHRTQDKLSIEDIAFIRERESVYIATTTPEGWPYVQHRGGPRGFLQVVGNHQIVCGDYPGNRQYLSMGNLQSNNKISLFCMDYMNKRRLKLQGHATLRNASDVAEQTLELLDTDGPRIERVLCIDVVAMDWNCPKYIPELYPAEVIKHVASKEIGRLQRENNELRQKLKDIGA
ncbi:pyridoxamine 5'-phosphate oxidase family protein [Shimia abyssi]|uniref:Pyridoxamine 5'-phosphate oxidase N-terminal domain-containing protein n=1 Tax=Shimia abyssi TaxID=1662395 RepID=A0A2P8FA02_9RHOB|nr:pyridoxamine 5'-phosphate oxidase family protein [Shimia abyssi]PSL18554.1 hypothetical protein CLV88_110135 [Shimia abyssi]